MDKGKVIPFPNQDQELFTIEEVAASMGVPMETIEQIVEENREYMIENGMIVEE
ncbi:hypothetical protein [Anaerophilus nitritogenes]|uniref:hypothetical protein n=1 Tax=Anaerophilus nitritogenes TaxID=2498136 RepID=UPI0013E9C25D|nr:hypothetical protein [Anaerophilus nitritogenes]